MKKRSLVLTAAVTAVAMIGTAGSAIAADQPIYVEISNTAAGTLTQFLTAGDVIGGKTVMGVPDGMGAYKNKDGTITLLSNHEISAGAYLSGGQTSDDFASRTERAYGGAGAQVSKYTIKPSTMQVTKVEEGIKKVMWYDYNTGKYGSTPTAPAGQTNDYDAQGIPVHDNILNRLCSAYLAPAGSLKGSGKNGWSTPLFFTAEEIGDDSRIFVLDPLTNTAYQMPRMGLASFENALAVPNTGDDTIVIATEDGGKGMGQATVSGVTAAASDLASGSQVFLYKGRKTSTGSPIDKAGLTNGYLNVLSINDATGKRIVDESAFRTAYPTKGTSVDATFVEIPWNADGQTVNIQARLKGTNLGGMEDLVQDVKDPNSIWFTTKSSGTPSASTIALAPSQVAATKASADGTTRDGGGIWKLTFTDISKPQLGAKIQLVLDGSEAPYTYMNDNLEFDSTGRYLMIQEDAGINDARQRLLAYDTVTKTIAVIAQFSDKYFNPKNTATYMTNDEETSGIINVTALLGEVLNTTVGETFLFNAQVHPLAGAVNAEVSIAKQTSITRPDLTFADDAAIVDFKTKVLEGGAYYKLVITDWSKFTWQ